MPSRFRNSIEEKNKGSLVVTGHPDGYLLLMFLAEYEKIEKEVRGRPDTGGRSLYYKQILIGMADDKVSLDKAGRIMLGPELREHAGIDGEVAVVGMLDHIRIWSKPKLETLNASFRDTEDSTRQLPDGWDGFSV